MSNTNIPRYDISEYTDNGTTYVVLCIDLPGVSEHDISVKFSGIHVTVTWRRESIREIQSTFVLPIEVPSPRSVSSIFTKDGVLTIEVEKPIVTLHDFVLSPPYRR